ncbi:uncharacterized protein LOC144161796 [Haemaphysalis longicornis]
MPEEEEDDDKKAKGKKADKKPDKGKKDNKKGGKDKGGGKGGSKKSSKSGSGGSKGKDKAKGKNKDKGKEKDKGKDKGKDKEKGKDKSKDKGKDKNKDKEKDKEKDKDKDKGEKPSKETGSKDDLKKDEKGKDGKDKAGKEEPLDFASPPVPARSGGMYTLWEMEKEKKKEPGGQKPLADLSPTDLPAGLGPLSPLEAVQKEEAKKPDKAEKSSDKSSLKSASSTEKSKTSKTGTTEKSEDEPGGLDQPKKKTSSKVVGKSSEPSSSKTVVRTFTSRGPVYADNYFGEDTDDEGSHSYIEIQMFGRQYPVTDQGWVPQSQAHLWEQSYRDAASQQRQVEWANNQQFYDDVAVPAWQASQPDPAAVRFGAMATGSPLLDAGGRNALVAQRLREVHQTLQPAPLTDDVVTSTERVIYEVTRSVPSKPSGMSLVDAPGRPACTGPGGGAYVLSSQATSQFQCPATGSQAVVRHEMRQSSATQLQAMMPAGRQASKRAPMYGPPGAGTADYGSGAAPPAAVVAAQRKQADILSQQASLISEQSNIIQQQSNIIEQQLGLMGALRGRLGRELDGPLSQDAPQGYAGPPVGTAPYGSVYFAVDYHDANQR